MDRQLQHRFQVLARTLRVTSPRRRGRIRAGVAAAALVASAGAAYTVTQGDTLSQIAQRHGVSVDSLVEDNAIGDPDLIVVGQVLTIPGQGGGAAAPASPTSSSGDGEATTHVVKPGESLADIAAQNGLTIEELAAANGITDVNRIHAGALLRIAASPPPTPGTGGGGGQGAVHPVAAGETLSGIAQQHGVSTSDIVEANDLADANTIFPGQELTIPGASEGPSWQCPVPGGEFINDFGVAKPDGRFHEGVDVFAPRGTLILAPVGGTIKHINGNRGGFQFTLRGDDGYTYIGTHLDAYGDNGRVEKGTPVGTVGNTGNAVGGPTHLHFEMHSGSVVNPYSTLRDYC